MQLLNCQVANAYYAVARSFMPVDGRTLATMRLGFHVKVLPSVACHLILYIDAQWDVLSLGWSIIVVIIIDQSREQ